jgi:cytochrome c-type biogenesis protein
MAAVQPSLAEGTLLLAFFSLGLGLPFLLLSLLWGQLWPRIRRLNRFSRWFGRILGAGLIVLGILLMFDKLAIFTFNYSH